MHLYFNAAVDTNWDTLGNWWEDAGCTIAASAIPSNADSVELLATVDANTGGAITIVDIWVNSSTYLATPMTVTGTATFRDGSYNGTDLTGDCIFEGVAFNNGTIVGDCQFIGNGSGIAANNAGIITGDCLFDGYNSFNNGTITGNCTFSGDTCYNIGTITGNCTFSGNSSYNNGPIVGDCIFSGVGSNATLCTIVGNVTLSGSGTYTNNLASITGNITATGENSSISGNISGIATLVHPTSFFYEATISSEAVFKNPDCLITTLNTATQSNSASPFGTTVPNITFAFLPATGILHGAGGILFTP